MKASRNFPNPFSIMTSLKHLSDIMTAYLTLDDVMKPTVFDESLFYSMEIAVLKLWNTNILKH